jgi:hypothetical protein
MEHLFTKRKQRAEKSQPAQRAECPNQLHAIVTIPIISVNKIIAEFETLCVNMPHRIRKKAHKPVFVSAR